MDLLLRAPGFRWLEALRYRLSMPLAPQDNAPEETRARRAFIDDALSANPEAFRSEQDVASMMFLYPGRF